MSVVRDDGPPVGAIIFFFLWMVTFIMAFVSSYLGWRTKLVNTTISLQQLAEYNGAGKWVVTMDEHGDSIKTFQWNKLPPKEEEK